MGSNDLNHPRLSWACGFLSVLIPELLVINKFGFQGFWAMSFASRWQASETNGAILRSQYLTLFPFKGYPPNPLLKLVTLPKLAALLKLVEWLKSVELLLRSRSRNNRQGWRTLESRSSLGQHCHKYNWSEKSMIAFVVIRPRGDEIFRSKRQAQHPKLLRTVSLIHKAAFKIIEDSVNRTVWWAARRWLEEKVTQ